MMCTASPQLARMPVGGLDGSPRRLPPQASRLGLVELLASGSSSRLHATLSSGGGSSASRSNSSSWLTSAGSSGFPLGGLWGRHSFSTAAAAGEPSSPDASDELLLWQHLRQCGFSESGIRNMRSAGYSGKRSGKVVTVVTGTRFSQRKIERDLAPKIAALRAEGLDTPAIEQLFVRFPGLLKTTHETFSRSLAKLRSLAALLPEEARAVQAPAAATQLGVALWLYPMAGAHLLAQDYLMASNLQLRRQLGVSDAEAARALFKSASVLASDAEKAAAMVAHLQGLQASGRLTADQVRDLVLTTGALGLEPAQFDRRWREGGVHALKCISLRDAGARQQEAAAVLGELLQAGDGVQGELQQRYRAQGEALVEKTDALVKAPAASLRASWTALRCAGMDGSELAAAVRMQPVVLTYNWEGEAKQLLAAWLQQELGLSLAQFLTQHAGYASHSVRRLALHAAFLQQHRPAVWESVLLRGTGPLLSLLSHRRFFHRADCTAAELQAFERAWLQTPAGHHWGANCRRFKRSTS